MILSSGPLLDWIADREAQLVIAWTPQLETALGWERPFAEAFAAELTTALITTFLREGDESNFKGVITRSNTGLDAKTERAVAGRFYAVTVKLARAAGRHEREARTRSIFSIKEAWIVGDSRTNPGHVALNGVTLPCDHPFWQRWHPPLDMDCRCVASPMMRTQYEREGRSMTSEIELAEREARLSGTWPIEFLPLLDFRRPLAT